ncbi:MAG: hypothetical protein ABSE58_00240 [Candidatus Limnocylindrales bacterium]|jgi:hypothetical protein
MRPVGIGTKGIRTRGLALIAAVLLLTLSLGAGTALADGGRHNGDAHNTFTKYISSYPAMAGVVGGDVGSGTYAGEILKCTPGTTTVIEALYHFNGSKHTFSALVHVEQTGLKAVITGVVTEAWLKGHPVEGKYTQITCTQSPNGTCFQGTLDILREFGG